MHNKPSEWEGRLRRVFASLPDVSAESVADQWLSLDLAEERAAILEFEAGLSREEANGIAFANHCPAKEAD